MVLTEQDLTNLDVLIVQYRGKLQRLTEVADSMAQSLESRSDDDGEGLVLETLSLGLECRRLQRLIFEIIDSPALCLASKEAARKLKSIARGAPVPDFG